MSYPAIFLLILTPIVALYGIQQLIVIPRLRKELFELNARRAQRVQQALACETEPGWMTPAPTPNFPFAGWLDLRPDGSLKIAGETFQTTNSFQATAKDDHNLLRATVICPGNGDVLIHSHGQSFVARFANNQWQVQPTGVQPI